MHEHHLAGCQPEPLGSYLKALGVLRLVAEQADPTVTGAWSASGFVLWSRLDRQQLNRFFLNDYQPSPIATPWNGAGGFYFREDSKTGRRTTATAATRALASVAGSAAKRLAPLRAAVAVAKRAVDRFGLEASPKDDEKHRLVQHLRDRLDDPAVAWLDAVLVVGASALAFPPVLGTGGTEGALDFASNLYQRLAELFGFADGEPTQASPQQLDAALFGLPTSGLTRAAIGQFDPRGAGGQNAAPGFDAISLVNPWDFVLLLEGTLLLASATTRRLENATSGSLVYPFSVRAVGADYASSDASDEDGTRHELWLPLWEAGTRRDELARLFGEGRADVHRRRAVHAVDFARAVGALGVDRGIAEFARFGFHQRNGKSYFATPLGRWRVRRNPHTDLIDAPIARWIDGLRRAASKKNAPATWGRAAKGVETAVFRLARAGNPAAVQALLGALANAEQVLSTSASGRASIHSPVPGLGGDWLRLADDGSVEHQLAMSLACTRVRERLTRARWSTSERTSWSATQDHRTVWGARPLVAGLAAVVLREEVESAQLPSAQRPPTRAPSGSPPAPASGAIHAFLTGRSSDAKLEALIRAYSLVRPSAGRVARRGASTRSYVPAAFALCALAHHRIVPGVDEPIHRSVGVVRALVAGQVQRATEIAVRRLLAAGVPLAVRGIAGSPTMGRRLAAALAFPTSEALAGVELAAVTLFGEGADPARAPSESL